MEDPRVTSVGEVVFGPTWKEDFINGGFRLKLRMLGQIIYFIETPRVTVPENYKEY